MSETLITVDIRYEQDIVLARQRARQIASLFSLPSHEQTAFATSVSELARNAFRYVGRGRAVFSIRSESRQQTLVVQVQDAGPGIKNLSEILSGQYDSKTGMGLGLLGAKRLSDEFDIQSAGSGTTVTIGKRLPPHVPLVDAAAVAKIANALTQETPQGPLQEAQNQNRELLEALDHLRARQADVERLNVELAETNRGVVALYAELDEKADSLKRASEYKTRFLSDMTHELRTPLNAMVSLSRLLLDRTDGDLTPEQAKQVQLIHKSATSLGEMVNDLLDIAKIEAGRVDLNVAAFEVSGVLAGLRGMFRPLIADSHVPLNIDEVPTEMKMTSDERKLSQVLRNLVSNALKFTEAGEVSVSVSMTDDDKITFAVADTGIGISPDHLETIFHDYTQIDSSIQRRVQGTGLGLPLTRKLARLLGGDVVVHSTPGSGSTFVVTLPRSVPVEHQPTESDVHA